MPDLAAPASRHVDLTRFAWLSIGAALSTIVAKSAAWALTGSVGLLSDAVESLVNLVAAVGVLVALRVAARPADQKHPYGHGKAEYFSAALEGLMIVVAAAVIIVSAVERFINPVPLANIGAGVGISVLAAVINGVVAAVLLRAGRTHHSTALRADGKHLLTDVWTSAGVVLAVVLVALTGWERLDPLIAVLVAITIVVTGWRILAESGGDLMDRTWPQEDNERLVAMVRSFTSAQVDAHGLRSRQAGRVRFAEMHLLVPGDWTIRRGHDLASTIEDAVRAEFPGVQVLCHIEPLEDPRAYADYDVDVSDAVRPPTPDAGDQRDPHKRRGG